MRGTCAQDQAVSRDECDRGPIPHVLSNWLAPIVACKAYGADSRDLLKAAAAHNTEGWDGANEGITVQVQVPAVTIVIAVTINGDRKLTSEVRTW